MNREIRPRYLYRYSQFLVVAVVFLLVAGAMVTSTGSGLAVPDWPLSFGQVMPPMEGGVFYEHGHRMVATGIGMLTIVLAVWLWRREARSWMRKLGWIALAMVIAQGLLGGLTVLLKLPVWTSAAHACLGQSFLLMTVFIAMALSPGWEAEPLRASTRLSLLAPLATAAIFIQLVLGAVMRHMNAGLVIPDFPLAFGGLVPPEFTAAIAIHYAHRVWAVVVAVCVIAAAVSALRAARGRRDFAFPAWVMLVLIVVQISLGAMVIWTQRQVHVTSTHVVTGAVLLGVSLVLSVRARRLVQNPGRVQEEPVARRRPELGKATV